MAVNEAGAVAGSFAGARRSENGESRTNNTGVIASPFAASSYAAATGQFPMASSADPAAMPRWRFATGNTRPVLLAQATTTQTPRIALAASNEGAGEVPERSEVPDALKWDLTDLYPTREAWEQAFARTKREIAALSTLTGTATASAEKLFAALDRIFSVKKELYRVASYAERCTHEDQRDSARQAMKTRAQQLMADFKTATAFLAPAIQELGQERIKAYLFQSKPLQLYQHFLDDLLRRAEHTLPQQQEAMLATLTPLTESGGNIYETFAYSDIPHPTVTLSDGTEVEVSTPMYARYRGSDNRDDRIAIFQAFWGKYQQFQNTFAKTLESHIKAQVEVAKLRHYGNAREAAMDDRNVAPRAYDAMLEGVHEGLPTLHRYLNLQKRMLGVEQLGYHDLYASIIPGADLHYSLDEGKELMYAALAPLGEEYVSTVRNGFENRWVDFMPNKGKYTGAYMSGEAYDVHPYVLLNWNGNFESVSTAIHEFGHAMHTWYTNRTQPFAYADYSIFVAEVPSTLNEILLTRHAIDTAPDRKTKLALLGEYLGSIRQTVFRQAQFAEFESQIYDKMWKGEPLTAEALNNTYGEILREYYGHDQGVTHIDDRYNVEWAYIPHFYYNFYVYKYTTSFVAAMAFAKPILEKEPGAVERFLNVLRLGNSEYPVESLKAGGVDMTTTDPYKACFAEMNRVMDEIEKLIAEEETEKLEQLQKLGQ